MKKLSLILIVTIALFAQPVTGQGPFGAPGSLQLVEASVPELQTPAVAGECATASERFC